MKFVVLAALCITMALAGPVDLRRSKAQTPHPVEEVHHEFHKKPVIDILDYKKVTDDAGQYDLYYVTGENTVVKSRGFLKHVNNATVLVIEGSHKYVSPEGRTIYQKYRADENGYMIVEEHIEEDADTTEHH